jgi:hypothetical protein
MAVSAAEGEALSAGDLVVVPGPGADDAIMRRFGKGSARCHS